MLVNKYYVSLLFFYSISFCVIAIGVIPWVFQAVYLPGDPSEYASKLLFSADLSPQVAFDSFFSQPVLMFYYFSFKTLGALGVAFVNSFLVASVHFSLHKFLLKLGCIIGKVEFFVIFVLLCLPLFFWYAQISKEALSLFGVVLFIINFNYCFNYRSSLYEPSLKNLAMIGLAFFACVLSRSYLTIFLLMYCLLFVISFDTRRILRSKIFVWFIAFMLFVSLTCYGLVFSSASMSRIIASADGILEPVRHGSFGSSPVIDQCISDFELVSDIPIVAALYNNRCLSFSLMGSQTSHAVDMMFVPYMSLENTYPWSVIIAIVYYGVSGIFGLNPLRLLEILLNGFSITTLLLVPGKFIFIFAFLNSIRVVRKNAFLRFHLLILFIFLFIFSVSEAHQGTLFRYSFPFYLFFTVIFLKNCRRFEL